MELAKECKKCLYEKEIKRAENIKNLLERKQYIKEVEYALEHLSFDSPPEYIDCFLKICCKQFILIYTTFLLEILVFIKCFKEIVDKKYNLIKN